MPKFRVHARVSGSKFLGEFEAATFEEAIGQAIKDSGHVSLCHQCCGGREDGAVEEDTAIAEIDKNSASPGEIRAHHERVVLAALRQSKEDWQLGISKSDGRRARKRLERKGIIRWNPSKFYYVIVDGGDSK